MSESHVIVIVGISGCTDSKSGILGSISKSSVSSKLAASQSSGIFSEKAYPHPSYSECKGMLSQYEAVYNNGDTLEIKWTTEPRKACDNKFFSITYNIKNPNSNDDFRKGDAYSYMTSAFMEGRPYYSGPSGLIRWTVDGRVDPSYSTGDINEANEVINLGKAKANEIMNRYNSGQLR